MKLDPEQYRIRDHLLRVQRATARPRLPPHVRDDDTVHVWDEDLI